MNARSPNLLASCLAAAVATAAGCATQPDRIAAQSVSSLSYEKYDCDQLALETQRVGTRLGTLYAGLKKTASNDEAQMAVGLILFWPALFFLEGGDGAAAAEYARLKGEYEAMEKAAVARQCDPATVRAVEHYIPRAAPPAPQAAQTGAAETTTTCPGSPEWSNYHDC